MATTEAALSLRQFREIKGQSEQAGSYSSGVSLPRLLAVAAVEIGAVSNLYGCRAQRVGRTNYDGGVAICPCLWGSGERVKVWAILRF